MTGFIVAVGEQVTVERYGVSVGEDGEECPGVRELD